MATTLGFGHFGEGGGGAWLMPPPPAGDGASWARAGPAPALLPRPAPHGPPPLSQSRSERAFAVRHVRRVSAAGPPRWWAQPPPPALLPGGTGRSTGRGRPYRTPPPRTSARPLLHRARLVLQTPLSFGTCLWDVRMGAALPLPLPPPRPCAPHTHQQRRVCQW